MSNVRIQLLGSPEAFRDGVRIAFARRKQIALLSYLAVEHGSHSRDSLADLLYPDQDRSHAYAGLRVILHGLRQLVGTDIIDTGASSVCLADGSVVTDTGDLETVFAETGSIAARVLSAKALYRGDFLGSFYLDAADRFERWQLAQQERWRGLYASFLSSSARALMDTGSTDDALLAQTELLRIDPADEIAHRSIMTIHASAGRFGMAIRQYQYCREVLAREFDVEPEEETTSIYRALSERERSTVVKTLPKYANSFIARESETAALQSVLSNGSARLITITGGPGVGKSRLAVHVAALAEHRFADGCVHVELFHTEGHDRIFEPIAQSVGIRDSGQGAFGARELVTRALTDRTMLIILDGFEIVAETATDVTDLLEACPGITVLVTSREALGVATEWTLNLNPLAVSASPGKVPDAAALFIERTRTSGIALRDSEVPHVVEICSRLEGVPLAIELAAARLDVLSTTELLGRIDRVLDLLGRSGTIGHHRYQTLRGAIDWSYQLLTDDERLAFEALSLCPAGVTPELVETLLSDLDAAALDLIHSLIRKSLLARADRGEQSTYIMLDSTREFAREKLLEHDRLPDMLDRAIRYYGLLGRSASSGLHDAAQSAWIERLEHEWPNIRMIMDELANQRRYEELLCISAHLSWFCYLTGRNEALASYLQTGLEDSDAVPHDDRPLPSTRAWAWHSLGWALFTRGEWDRARLAYRAAEELFVESGATQGRILAVAHLGVVERWLGNDATGVELSRKAVVMAHEAGSDATRAIALIWAYATTDGRRLHPGQREGLEEALRLCRTNGDLWGIAHALHGLGDLSRESGRFRESLELYEEALVGFRHLRDRWLEAWTLAGMGTALMQLDEHREAAMTFINAAVLFRDLGDNVSGLLYLLWMALSLAHLGDAWRSDGASLLAAFLTLRDDLAVHELGSRLLATEEARAIIADCEVNHRVQWTRGHTMPLDAVIDLAIDLGGRLHATGD